MTRTVPALLLAHLQQNSTTTCRLLKVRLRSGVVYGITTLDRNVEYDDGTVDGVITYVATNGFDPSALAADVGFSVDNSEGYALISEDIPGVTVEMVQAGELDDAHWVCYLVNFEDLTMGHTILDAGDLGDVQTRFGMVWIPELLSYMTRLRQPVGHVWSTTCRAVFGSPADSQTGCGVDLGPLWAEGTVTAVGAETNRVFTGTVLAADSPGITPVPGRVQWLYGNNAGQEFAVEEVDGLEISLLETTGYPIEIGDEYRIRPDCRKRYLEDCIGIYDNGPNFKGEPLIPVGDASQVQTPGAQLPGGGGWIGNVNAAFDNAQDDD